MDNKIKEVIDVETKTLNSSNKNNDVTYRIFDYFKEHPSLFITTISTFVAIISVALNLIAYLGDNSYLKYFNVSVNIYKQSVGFIYFLAIALVFFIVIIVFNRFIYKTFENYSPYKRVFLLYKYLLKNIKIEKKKFKKMNRKIEASLFDLSKKYLNKSESRSLKKDLRKEFNEIENENVKTKKRDALKLRIFYYLIISLSCSFAWFVLAIVYALMLSFATFDWAEAAKSAIVVSTIYVLISSIEYWLLTCVLGINRKEIKTCAQPGNVNGFLEKYYYPDKFPINEFFDGNFRSIFNDSNLKRLVSATVLSLSFLMFLAPYSNLKGASSQKDFFVVDIEKQTYVVIYNNGENAILEKAEIIENCIIIDTNHQKMISSQNVDMRKYIFENVDLIRTEHSFNE